MDSVEITDETGKEAAAAAKAKGTSHFSKAEYADALAAYQEAASHDNADHVFPSNICACYLELAKKEYEEAKKVDLNARAFLASQQCVKLNASWVKGHLRQATAEAELLAAVAAYEERKAQRKEPTDFDGKPWPVPDPSLQPAIDAASYASCEAACRAGLALEAGNAALRLRLQLLRDGGHVVGEDKEAADRALVDAEAAAPLKAEGNKLFGEKKYTDAVEKYTAALSFNPFDHVFYSNRSACYAAQDDEGGYKNALRDADACLKISPTFVKGHSRRSAALFGLGRYADAEAAAVAGLEGDPESAALKELLAAAKVETAESPEVQAQMHSMRVERSKNEKMKKMLSGLNFGGSSVQMFNPGSGGGLGGLFGGGGGNLTAPAQTDDQMRQLARAIAGASKQAGAAE